MERVSVEVPRTKRCDLTERVFALAIRVGALVLAGCGTICGAPSGGFSTPNLAAPPIPAPMRYTVTGREMIRFPLQVVGGQSEVVTFIIRKPPQSGALRLTRSQGEAAQVEYTPPSDRTINTDSFTFVAANSRGVSGEALVQIKIVDRGAKLETAPFLNFGTLRVGSTKSLPLEVHNSGDMPSASAVNVTLPWFLSEKESAMHLAPGHTQTVLVNFTPSHAGSFSGELRFNPDPSSTVNLSAEVRDWLIAGPDPVHLLAAGKRIRAGTLQLTNENDSPQTVSLVSKPPLEHPAEVTLAPHQKVDIPLRSKSLTYGHSGMLTLVGAGQNESKVLLWEAEPLGAALGGLEGVKAPLVLSYDSARPASKIRLRNDGGQSGVWSLQCPEGCGVRIGKGALNSQATLRLEPGESVEVFLSLSAPSASTQLGVFSIQGPDGNAVLELVAEAAPRIETTDVPTPAAAPAKLPSQRRSSPSHSQDMGSAALDVAPQQSLLGNSKGANAFEIVPDPETYIDLNQAFAQGALLNGLIVTNVTSERLTLIFPIAPSIAPEQLIILFRSFEPSPDGKPSIQWRSRAPTEGHRDASGKMVLNVRGLKAGALNTIRLLGPDRGDGMRVILHQCDIVAPKGRAWLALIGGSLLVLLTMVGGWIWAQKRYR